MTSIAAESLSDERASAGWLARALRAALDRDRDIAARLRHARTSVRFELEDGPVVLMADRDPPTVEGSATSAEITVALDAAQAARYGRGELPLAEAIIRGEVVARGPIRKFLEVDPILRTLLRDGTPPDPLAHAAPRGAPELLVPDEALLAIETRGLSKAFGAQQVLDGADLTIPEGMITVVLGPSGTGKSVLLKHIIGALRPDAGEVLVRGRPLRHMSRTEGLALRREIGVMFQDGALFSAMDVYDNVAFPLRQHTNLSESDIRMLVGERLAAVGLTAAADRLPNELSGGMRKRAGLARALVLAPRIVLCDEPDSGLDPVRTALLGELLVQQHAENGGSMVVVTHNVALARLLADFVCVLWRGRVTAAGLAGDVFASEDPFVAQFLGGNAHGPLGMDA